MFLYECQVPGIQYTVAVHEQLSDIVASGLLLGSIRHQVCPPPPPPPPPKRCCEIFCWQALLDKAQQCPSASQSSTFT